MRERITNEKSGNPTQPSHRSSTANKKKQKNIVHRIARIYKRMNWKGRALLVLLMCIMLTVLFIIGQAIVAACGIQSEEIAPAELPPVEYAYPEGSYWPVDFEALTSAWASEAGFEKRYSLTDAERWLVAQVVTAEAEGEPYAGKMAVAQCILQSCEDDGIRPAEVLTKYGYSGNRPEPCEEALEAVQDVFDFGNVATYQPIKYFYAPARVHSDWHETQVHVLTINGHKFFKEAE